MVPMKRLHIILGACLLAACGAIQPAGTDDQQEAQSFVQNHPSGWPPLTPEQVDIDDDLADACPRPSALTLVPHRLVLISYGWLDEPNPVVTESQEQFVRAFPEQAELAPDFDAERLVTIGFPGSVSGSVVWTAQDEQELVVGVVETPYCGGPLRPDMFLHIAVPIFDIPVRIERCNSDVICDPMP